MTIRRTAIFVLSLLGSIGTSGAIFYLYDKVHNRAVTYDFADVGNIYYTSQNFHSLDYAKQNNTCSFAKKFNSSRSLPVMRLC